MRRENFLKKSIKKIRFYAVTTPIVGYYAGKLLWKRYQGIPYRPKINKCVIGGFLIVGLLSITKNCNLLEKKINQAEYQEPTAIVETINKDYSDNRLEQILKN